METSSKIFNNAQQAFEFLYKHINSNGLIGLDNKFILNYGFYIENPVDNYIKTDWRNWKKDYAELEWEWYLSKNRSVSEIKKHAKIWDKMHSGNNLVNSNYGYQWSRNNQLDFVIQELIKNPSSRRAVLSIYDGKEIRKYRFDTPCTLNIVFNITDSKLNMSVLMRSNDLWFGFCNDQYCFSKLQELVSKRLNIKIGWYYHFVNNLHIYSKFLNRAK